MRLDNDITLLTIKVVALIKFMETILNTINTASKYGVHPYYGFFDTCAYFLMKFQDTIDIGMFTEITFLLIRKNS